MSVVAVSPTAAARRAAQLLMVAGLLTIANNYLPGSDQLDVPVLNLVGLTAIALALISLVLPWHRWPWAATLIFAPVGFALIALANRFGGVSAFSYATYFVLAFTWVGLTFPPKTSFLLAPVATVAYVLPGVTLHHGPRGSVVSVTVAIPVCVLVGETVSRAVRRLHGAMRDATEQKDRYRRLVDLSQQGIWEVDAEARTMFVNRPLASMLGYTPAEMTGMPLFAFLAGGDSAGRPDRCLGALQFTEDHEIEFRHRDGSVICAVVNTQPIVGPDGTPLGAIATVIDVTEQRYRDTALREAEERFRLAFTNAPIGMSLTSLDGHFLQVNGALSEMLGRAPQELVGMTVPSVSHPGEWTADRTAMREMREGPRRSYATEKRYLRPDGEIVWARLHAAVVRDENGSPLYFVSQMEDITERKQAEAALRAGEERTRRILETAGDAYVAIDEDGRITDWNRQAEMTFGWTTEEILGRPLDETIIPPEFREAHRRGMDHFLRTGEAPALGRRLELTALHRDGRTIPIELIIWALRQDNGWCFNAFLRDVSQRKELEAELQRLALVDDLTGLRNRRSFLAVAEALLLGAQRNQRNLALLYIDLDNMKEINDQYGHSVGDRALIETAELLCRTFRESDIIARLGGDEFCVLLDDDGVGSEDAIERLTENVHSRADGPGPSISLSVGLARYRWDDPCPIEGLIEQADTAMYEHKAHKRRVVELL